MIELLGVGVPRPEGGWLLHRVCATLEAGAVTVVLSVLPEERCALLDAITGRRLPEEGRVWVGRVPLMRSSVHRIRGLVAEVDPAARLVEHRSLFWNALAPDSGPRALGRLLRLPRRGERQAVLSALDRVGLRARSEQPVSALATFDRLRLLVARALARRPRYLVVREAGAVLGGDEVGRLLALVREAARRDRLGVVVSLASGMTDLQIADRLVVIGDGLLLFQGRVEALPGERGGRRLEMLTS